MCPRGSLTALNAQLGLAISEAMAFSAFFPALNKRQTIENDLSCSSFTFENESRSKCGTLFEYAGCGTITAKLLEIFAYCYACWDFSLSSAQMIQRFNQKRGVKTKKKGKEIL